MAKYKLYKPSLNPKHTYKRKTYPLNWFYAIGAIGGPVPVMILGARNAYWVRLEKLKICGLLCLGLVVIAIEFGISAVGGTGHTVLVWTRLGGFGLGALCNRMLRRKTVLGEQYWDLSTVKVLVPAVVWMGIGIGTECILGLLGKAVAHGLI